MKTFAYVTLFTLFLSTTGQAGTIYKVVLADGTVMYTDQPTAQAEEVKLPASTDNRAAALAKPKPAPLNTSTSKPASYTLSIVSPAPEATIRNNAGNISIQSQATPPLKSGLYELWLNGTRMATNTTGQFSLQGLDRGAYTYFVKLLDNKGKSLASTPQQTFYLHKASAQINAN